MTICRSFFALLLTLLLCSAPPRALAITLLNSNPTEVIVQLKPDADITRVLRSLSGLVLDDIPGADLYLISVPVVPILLPKGVVYIEPNLKVSLPADLPTTLLNAAKGTAADWYKMQNAFRMVQSNEAHAYTTGAGIIVADIDARFDLSHPALAGHMTPGWDFVSERDGGSGSLDQSSSSFMFEDEALNQSSSSFMFEDEALDQSSSSFMFEDGSLFQSSSSFMFEDGSLYQSSSSFMFEDGLLDQSSSSFMFEGVSFINQSSSSFMFDSSAGNTHGTFTAGVIVVTAPGAAVMPLRAFDSEGKADTFVLAKAIRYAVEHGALVINMSWGTSDDSKTLRNAIRFASRKGVTLVSSAGNSNTSSPYYPAAYPEVMAVSATDDIDRKADFSSYGSHVYVSAPGVNIISTMPDGRYGMKSGTSFSAPMVAGQAALLRSMQVKDVEGQISSTSKNIDEMNPGHKNQLGRGRINFLNSISN